MNKKPVRGSKNGNTLCEKVNFKIGKLTTVVRNGELFKPLWVLSKKKNKNSEEWSSDKPKIVKLIFQDILACHDKIYPESTRCPTCYSKAWRRVTISSFNKFPVTTSFDLTEPEHLTSPFPVWLIRQRHYQPRVSSYRSKRIESIALPAAIVSATASINSVRRSSFIKVNY